MREIYILGEFDLVSFLQNNIPTGMKPAQVRARFNENILHIFGYLYVISSWLETEQHYK